MRKSFLVPIAFAAALVAAAPAFAQRASLADRVASLEQQAANNQGNVDLLNQLTALRSEVTTLRSQIEELQQQVTQMKSQAEVESLDTDSRLQRLEGGAMPAPAANPQGSTQAPAGRAAPALPALLPDAGPTVRGDAGNLAKSADERAAYEEAFAALRGGRYADSANLFQSFLQLHPSGQYAPNALYWLGESYYATQNYAMAQTRFEQVVAQFPTHDKAPGALLKVGLSQYGARQVDAAEATLTEVAQRYPGTDAARTAEDQLRAMQMPRLR